MNVNELLVSIIIPVYNVNQYIDRCIKSVIEQTYKNLEIILVDDGSTDDSGVKCDKYAKADSRIRVIHKENGGVSETRNYGIEVAKGDFISFIDADDWVDEEFIKKLVYGIKNTDIAVCGYEKVWEKGSMKFLIDKREYKYIDRDNFFFHALCDNLIGSYLCNKLFRAELMAGLQLDKTLLIGEDMDFLTQYMKRCNSIQYIDECLYKYRIVKMSAMNRVGKPKENKRKWISALEATKKVERLLEDESNSIRNYIAYRIVRSSVWVMFRMILEGYYDDTLGCLLKQYIKNSYSDYKKVKCGSRLQKIVVIIMRIYPKGVYMVGYLCNRIVPNCIRKIAN